METIEGALKKNTTAAGYSLLDEKSLNSGQAIDSGLSIAGTAATYAILSFLLSPKPVQPDEWKDSSITLIGYELNTIEPSQRWYWTEWWQKAESEADEALLRGKLEVFNDMDAFLQSL